MADTPTAAPVAIVGMHRTGTSMVTKALHDAGLALVGSDAEDLIDPAEDNPEGFWENKAVVALNDDLLEACGGSWDNPPELVPQAVDDPRVAHLAERASEILAGLRAHEHWGFKDPRTSLTARFWMDLQPDLRFLVCVRSPLEVALSLKRRNQSSYSLGLALWERYYREVLDAVPEERRLVTHYDAFFLDPTGEAARICEFAGLEPIRPRVRTGLRHHTVDVTLGEAGVSQSARALYAELTAAAGLPQPPEPPADEGKVRRMVLDGLEAKRVADLRLDHIKVLEAQHVRDEARIRELENSWGNMLQRLVKRGARKAAGLDVGKPVRAGREALSGATSAAKPKARRIVQQLPPPARRALRKGLHTAEVVRAQRRPLVQRARLGLLAVAERGPRLDEWKDAYLALLRDHLPAGRRWAVVHPGTTSAVRRLGPGTPTPFPDAAMGGWPADDQGLIGHLEALRYAGVELLVVPEGARHWFAANRRLRDHTRARFREVADVPGAGAVYDLTAPPAEGARTLLAAVASLVEGTPGGLAVLDWTEAGVADELPGTATFRPRSRDRLPYLDASVDVVIVDARGNLDEARRVAAHGVVVVDTAAGTAVVRDVLRRPGAGGDAAGRSVRAALLVPADAGERWLAALREAVADTPGAVVELVEVGAGGADLPPSAEVVLVLEPGVVPLPGALAAAAAHAADDPDAATTGKVLRADGRLDAAGGTVFSDRSVAGIGAGSLDVRGPWHEFVRPVCWPVGVLAVARPTWDQVGQGPPATDHRAWLREWGAAAWAAGRPVRYQPDVVVVRAEGDGSEPASPVAGSAWQRVVDLRPARPGVLDDGAWQHLVATDDVAAIRG